MQSAVIADFVRTPFHFARKGALTGVRPDDMAAHVLRALVERTGIDPLLVDDVLFGCAYPEGEQGDNLARIAILLAGLPLEVPGMTMNRFCGSSMSAIHIAVGHIAAGAGEAFVCGGVESMSRVPQGGFSSAPNPRFRRHDLPDADLMTEAYVPMGTTAETVAKRWNIGREAQDAFAAGSQRKAAAAQAAGRFETEIARIATGEGVISSDGCLRPATTLEGLAALKPAFTANGSVTAGTASPLTDGAVAALVCSEAFATRNGLEPLARIRAMASAGCPPEIMGIGPVPATRKALARAGLTIDDLDVVELNEAFASQALACLHDLAIAPEKVNLDGGAIALGHPLGATGARITAKAAQILKREGARFALATQCVGGGQGVATILEAL